MEKMEEMGTTVDKLEALFQKAESDINYVSRKLDSEFSEMATESAQANPKDLVERLQTVKKEYANIVKEAEEIKKAQEEAADFFKSQLQLACQTIQKIQEKSGVEVTEKTEDEKLAESVVGLDISEEKTQVEGLNIGTSVRGSEDDTSDIYEGACASPDENIAPSEEEGPSAAERRANGEFIEVSDEEFMSVSSLVRGRVKLEDVNRVYQVLYEHFKEQGHKRALTTQDMSKMHLRITGATGEAKLKVLRALKILSLNTKGDVKML
ncbi:SKA complex subunit 2-like [Glandiceps talaboti]